MSVSNWIEVIRTCNLSKDKKMDVVSKWLIITRSCVFAMTLLSGFVGGILAAIDGHFHLWRFLLVLVGLTLAHAANNMVNDLYDLRQGVDTEDYPRAKYAPHPILSGMVSRGTLIAAILICYVLDLAIAICLSIAVGWWVMAFAVAGVFFSVFYVAPPLKLKHRGLGELAIFIIWGPLMVMGSYYVMSSSAPIHGWLASVPYGLAVTSVLMGKHLDKAEKDREKKVRTLPVVLGDANAKLLTQIMVFAFYLIIVAEVASGVLPWPALMALLSLPHAMRIISVLSQPTPATPQEAFKMAEAVIPKDLKEQFDPNLPAEEYPLWPLWYVAWGVWWTRIAGGFLVLGLILQALYEGIFR